MIWSLILCGMAWIPKTIAPYITYNKNNFDMGKRQDSVYYPLIV